MTAEEWAQAREAAALAEIEMLTADGRRGFYPSDIMAAFKAGMCDTSGNVAAFLEEE